MLRNEVLGTVEGRDHLGGDLLRLVGEGGPQLLVGEGLLDDLLLVLGDPGNDLLLGGELFPVETGSHLYDLLLGLGLVNLFSI